MVCFKGFSQPNEYHFKNLTTSDGLSQSSVIAIHQDYLGQMWLGTRDGLNKYDGSKFTVYKNNPSDSLSISNNDILAIDEDTSGNIWIGTYNGLNCYDPVSNTFKNFFHSNSDFSLNNNTVWCIKVIKDEIWIGTSNGLSVFNKKTGKFISAFMNNENSESLPDNFILKILQSKNGDIWIGTANGLCKLIKRVNNSFYFKNYAMPIEALNSANNLYVQDILEDNENNIWIATKTNGLFKYDEASDKLIPFINKKDNPDFDFDFRAIGIDKQGNLWLGTYSGVYILKDKKISQAVFENTVDDKNFSKIKCIYLDKKGSVWVGTYYNGVNLWDETNSNFTNLTESKGKNVLSYNVVGSIVSDFKETICFGTEGGGVTVLNTTLNTTNYINVNNTKGLSSDNIKTLFLDNQDLWIGTFGKGLSVYNLKDNRIENKKISSSLNNLLDKQSVYVIKKESDDVVWLGTFSIGLIRYNLKNKTFKVFKNEESANSISSNRIRSVLIDDKKKIWVGTQSGLNVIKFENGKERIERFFYDQETQSGKDILTIFEDSNKNIWVGIKAKGFYLFDGKQFNKIKINYRGLEITSVHSVIEDKRGNLWLSSNSGIVKYNPNSKTSIVYSQTDGLISNEFNDNSNLKFNDNQFYFGGPAGVSYFNPNNISINNYAPQVLLTDFKIKNNTVKVNSDEGVLKQSIAYTKSVTLSYDRANFSINFSIPNFINSSNNQYSYRLVGLENEWTTTKNTEAAYTIQNAGTYLFEVKGANNDGVWNTTPTTLTIIVKPAPWKSVWAFTMYALLIGLALYGLIWIMKSKAKLKHELQLEHIEAERNKEIHSAKLQFFTNISHEFRTPLTLILGPLQQILSNYNGSNILYKKLLVIESSANHLLQLINRLMDFRKLEDNQFKLEAAEGNIVKFLREIFLSFSEFAKDGGYTYTFNTTNEEILVYYDRYKFERVFYNLISNAFRYTPKGGQISIDVIKEDNQISIEIEDSGVGISEEYIDKVFDRFFEVSIHKGDQKSYNKGTGIGLSIAKNIVNLHKGTISVKNKTSQGVVFKVTLPLGNSHLSEKEIIKDFVLSDDVSQYISQLSSQPEVLEEDLNDLIREEKKHTILLVEDNKELRSFLKNLLKKDYNILQAENGKAAMKKALKHVPDLIVSDVIMPEMVGTELCSLIKSNLKTSHIPVILLTSRTSLIYKFEGLESGADDYISKPFNLKEFKLRIYNLLESKERLKEKFSNQNVLVPSDIAVTSLDEELLKKAFEIVEQNISNVDFDIPTFCSELGVSRSILFAKIKAWTNFTPNKFILEIRLKGAAQLLEQNKINVSQVSYKVGFNNPKYFSKCFQNKYGITPTQYANKFSEDK
ncbi:hybrid sensor histidine kinase/response regulator transcription factor [Yeosuana marina]|uniref:hybrid sensor histidine kinase/response regulator transcription factor n=1 Tax=Yeosuana marina TaxID=1565536 RepID=UPI0014224AA7|nr:hybrid sensor histidine kinase/response regulator transcription factor [Yeosuana marina]